MKRKSPFSRQFRKKNILFGKFSDEIDHNKKVAAWKEVLVIAKSLEIVTEQRDWTYLRDSIWGQWRSRALVMLV